MLSLCLPASLPPCLVRASTWEPGRTRTIAHQTTRSALFPFLSFPFLPLQCVRVCGGPHLRREARGHLVLARVEAEPVQQSRDAGQAAARSDRLADLGVLPAHVLQRHELCLVPGLQGLIRDEFLFVGFLCVIWIHRDSSESVLFVSVLRDQLKEEETERSRGTRFQNGGGGSRHGYSLQQELRCRCRMSQ